MAVFKKLQSLEAKQALKGKAKRRVLAAADPDDSSASEEDDHLAAASAQKSKKKDGQKKKKTAAEVEKSQASSAKDAKKELRKKLRSKDYVDWQAVDDEADALVRDVNGGALGRAADDDASSSDDDNTAAPTTTTAAAGASKAAKKLTRKQNKLASLVGGVALDEGKKAAAASSSSAADGAAAATEDGAAAAPTEVNFSEPAQWVERMVLVATKPLPADLDPNDDPKREEVFLQHGLLSVMRGVAMLEKANVPWRRPEDYYAEMFKTDVHMDRIREKILQSKSRIQEQTHRRAMKDQKKFGKEVQAEVLRQRAHHKRDLAERLSDWRKKKGQGAGRGNLDEIVSERFGEEKGEYYKGGGIRGSEFAGDDKSARRAKFQGKKKSMAPGKSNNRPGKNRRRNS